jgi:hypothetical protein
VTSEQEYSGVVGIETVNTPSQPWKRKTSLAGPEFGELQGRFLIVGRATKQHYQLAVYGHYKTVAPCLRYVDNVAPTFFGQCHDDVVMINQIIGIFHQLELERFGVGAVTAHLGRSWEQWPDPYSNALRTSATTGRWFSCEERTR